MSACTALRQFVRLLVASPLLFCLTSHSQPITVQVERQGDEIIIDVEARVQVPVKNAWAVLTDYGNMATFLSSLKKSSVIQRRGNALHVAQSGEQRHGVFHFAFDTVREVELVPEREIRSRLVKGSFKRYEATTRLVDNGSSTMIIHHGRYVPETWVPPLIGQSVIRDKAMQQYAELITEMLKRRSLNAVKLGASASHRVPPDR